MNPSPAGIDPSVIGAAVRAAVQAGEPYVFSDHDRMDDVRARFDRIVAAADRI
jgi:hypothetical protein